jgi:hypothetical protein
MTRSLGRFLPALGLALVFGSAFLACASSDQVSTESNPGTGTGSGTTTGTATGSGGSGGATVTTTTSSTSSGAGGHGGQSGHGGQGGYGGAGGGHGGVGGAAGHAGGAAGGGTGGAAGGVGGGPSDAGADVVESDASDAGDCHQNVEICDGLDNNCNGQIDENDPGGGLPCKAQAFGECQNGTTHCIKGKIQCVAGKPSPEICDGLDNNCDGNVDEGNPGGGNQCQTNLLGICATGITTCAGAQGDICKPNVTPGQLKESCNGLDDDCNGLVDDNIAQVGQPCTDPSQKGICASGTYVCPQAQPIVLTCDHPLPGQVAETCNGKDDDCDGIIDNPNLVNGLPCPTGLPGVCAAGATQCVAGSQACNPVTKASAEICDGLDNDCNGVVDDIPKLAAACQNQLPGAGSVSQWTCGGVNGCQIVTCDQGHADINNAPGDGCECATDSWANDCNAVGSVGVALGNSADMAGKVESAAGSDYLRFNFQDRPIPADYHPQIQLVDSGGGQYAMDVLSDCNTPVAGQNNETGTKVSVWEQNYNGYVLGPGCCSDATPHVTSVIVRIYRLNGDAPTCTNYKVTASDP